MQITLAPPSDVENYERDITAIGNTVNDPELFIRIKEACLNERAFLFVVPVGFFILRPIAGPGVLIWAAKSFAGLPSREYYAVFDRLALEVGAQFIEFWSVRKGFERIAPRYGYEYRTDFWRGRPITVWRKPLCSTTSII